MSETFPQPNNRGTPSKLTPTERLHELAMAAITKPSRQASDEISLGQIKVGAHTGQWACDKLELVRGDDETALAYWSRTLEVARQINTDLLELNAGELRDKLEQSVAQLSGKRGAK